MEGLLEGLISVAAKEAAAPGGRERIAKALRGTLAWVEGPTPQLITPGTQRALAELASGLTLAAAAVAHIADHAQIILPPP